MDRQKIGFYLRNHVFLQIQIFYKIGQTVLELLYTHRHTEILLNNNIDVNFSGSLN